MSEAMENEMLESEYSEDIVLEDGVEAEENENSEETVNQETSATGRVSGLSTEADARGEILEEKVSVSNAPNMKQEGLEEARWYVVHTYSGYENKVKTDIEKTIENRQLQDQILEVLVPLQDVVEVKNGTKKQVSRKMFPGYVLLNMIMNDATWYVVRNTRGVTGFVGPGSKPVPLTEDEMRNLGIKIPEMELDVELGDLVKVTSGAWEGTVGTIMDINAAKQAVTIEVDIFGRATSVEISFMDVTKLD